MKLPAPAPHWRGKNVWYHTFQVQFFHSAFAATLRVPKRLAQALCDDRMADMSRLALCERYEDRII